MTPLNSLLTTTNLFLQNAHIPWAICGGFALDLFLGKETRPITKTVSNCYDPPCYLRKIIPVEHGLSIIR